MPSESKIRRDNNTGYPKYDQFTEYEDGKHDHRFGGYTKNGTYYEGYHGENTDNDTKKDSGKLFRKSRGD